MSPLPAANETERFGRISSPFADFRLRARAGKKLGLHRSAAHRRAEGGAPQDLAISTVFTSKTAWRSIPPSRTRALHGAGPKTARQLPCWRETERTELTTIRRRYRPKRICPTWYIGFPPCRFRRASWTLAAGRAACRGSSSSGAAWSLASTSIGRRLTGSRASSATCEKPSSACGTSQTFRG